MNLVTEIMAYYFINNDRIIEETVTERYIILGFFAVEMDVIKLTFSSFVHVLPFSRK